MSLTVLNLNIPNWEIQQKTFLPIFLIGFVTFQNEIYIYPSDNLLKSAVILEQEFDIFHEKF